MRYRANRLQEYMKEHMPLYLFVSVLFIMGVVFGALMVNALSLEQKQEMSDYLGSFFYSVDQGSDAKPIQSFQQSFGTHLRWVLLIGVLGLSVVGLPVILALNFLKGVLVGFSVGYLVAQLSWKGMLFSLVSIAPQNLVIIPVILISSVTAISFSMYLVRNRLMRSKGSSSFPFRDYLTTHLALCGLLLAISLFETFITPVLMRWVTPLLIA